MWYVRALFSLTHTHTHTLTHPLFSTVSIMPGVESTYLWESKVCTESEFLLVIKTTTEKQEELTKFVHSVHPYDTPEIITYVDSRFWMRFGTFFV